MTPEMALAKMLANSVIEAEVEKTASVEDPLIESKEKLAWADKLGRELAREHMEKISAIPSLPAVGSMVQKGLGHSMQALTTSSGVKRGLVGAGVGAVGGALKSPGVDPATGQQKSRLGNMAMGAGLGAGAGVASGHLARAAGSMNNTVGKTLGGAQTAVAKQTGNLASVQQAKQMAVSRGQSQRVAANNPFAGGKKAPTSSPVAPAAPKPVPAAAPTAARPELQPTNGMTLQQVRSGQPVR